MRWIGRPPIFGIVAGVCSTVSFAPQVIKIWRDHDTSAISLRMYVITVAGFCLWIGYGVLLGSAPIIVFNTLSLGMAATILAFKLKNRKADAAQAP